MDNKCVVNFAAMQRMASLLRKKHLMHYNNNSWTMLHYPHCVPTTTSCSTFVFPTQPLSLFFKRNFHVENIEWERCFKRKIEESPYMLLLLIIKGRYYFVKLLHTFFVFCVSWCERGLVSFSKNILLGYDVLTAMENIFTFCNERH